MKPELIWQPSADLQDALPRKKLLAETVVDKFLQILPSTIAPIIAS